MKLAVEHSHGGGTYPPPPPPPPLGHAVIQLAPRQNWVVPFTVAAVKVSAVNPPAFVCAVELVFIGAPTLPLGGAVVGSVQARTN